MAFSKENKEARMKIKMNYLDRISTILADAGDEVLRVKEGSISIPTVLPDGTEDYIIITFVSPTGSAKGSEPYDGHAEAQEYAFNCERKKLAKAEKEAKSKASKA